MFPPRRTGLYATWEACAEIGIKPPGVRDSWDGCDIRTQALILAFKQTRDHDRAKEITALAKCGVMRA